MQTSPATPQQHARFQNDGYVAFPEFLDERQMTELQQHVVRFINDVLPSVPSEEVFFEDRDDPCLSMTRIFTT